MMTDTREKLIELLHKSFAEQYERRALLTAPHTADHLIANGVSLRKKGAWITYERYCCNSDGDPVVMIGEVYVCSECGRKEPCREPFCHCGAEMIGGNVGRNFR